ncbi:aspartate aminotransferase family protein [Moorena producens]|uniref:aspartate aminotransferase family protein n=1 Tax=Moorena producens TaxID=1155739 RepID=UPI003C7187C9
MSPETIVNNPSPPAESAPARGAPYDLTEFDARVMKTYGRFPIALERGAGCHVWDTSGRDYLDFVAGIATCTLGHAHPVVVETVIKQIQKLNHVSNLYYIPEQGALAKWLIDHSCAERVFFCNSGAEANEAAIKLARKYGHTVLEIEQPVILTAQASFHGRTLATITATGQPKYQKNFDPLVPGFEYVPYNNIQALENAIADIDEGNRRVAAVMLEPLQGEGGVRPGDLDYFQQVRKICNETGILLILDEVQVGMGRTGKYWGYQNLGIEPDIFTSAKGLAGGIPIGAMMSKKFCDIFQPGEHASTFGGNPFVCAVALSVGKTLEQENILQNVQVRGEQLRTRLSAIADKYPEVIEEVRGWGLINGLELKSNIDLTSIDVVKAVMERGLLLVPAGPKVVRFVPPLIVSAEEVDQAALIVEQALQALA